MQNMEEKLNKRKWITLLIVALAFSQFSNGYAGETETEKDTIKLAIVMGGAVSLGAFEAGSIVELVKELECYNLNKNNKVHYLIDILGGASAGSMTLGILAHELFFSKADTVCENSNYSEWQAYADSMNNFYQSWVKEVDIKKLLPAHRKKLKDDLFLFSSDSVKKIAGKFINDDTTGHKLKLAPDKLHIAMTLANMSGIEKTIEFEGEPDDKLHFYMYDDARYFSIQEGREITITNADGDSVQKSSWDEIKMTALASGAFPFAFAPILLGRHIKEVSGGISESTFSYSTITDSTYMVDGGFFNNDPLHLAKEIARRIDKDKYKIYDRHKKPEFKRKFIYLAPKDVEETNRENKTKNFDPKVPTELGKYFPHLIKMAFATARTLDHRLYLQDEAKNLKNIYEIVEIVYNLRNDTTLTDKLLKTIQIFSRFKVQSGDIGLMKAFINYNPAIVNKDTIDYAENLDTLFNDIVYFKDDKRNGPIWLNGVTQKRYKQLYVDLFNIRGCQPQNKYILISNDDTTKLGGSKYAHFGGFLNEDIRKYDYQLGRYFASKALKNKLGIVPEHPMKKPEPKSFETLKDHITMADRQILRTRVDKRLIAYSRHSANLALATPVLKSIDHYLDKVLYRTPEPIFVSLYINSDRPRSFNFSIQMNPWNLFRSSFAQPSGLGWINWFLTKETHFVIDAGFTDFIKGDFPWVKNYTTSLGFRLRLYHPYFLDFIKLQPELGITFASAAFQEDIRRDSGSNVELGERATYFGLSLRIYSFELKVMQFYPKKPFSNGSEGRINFGLSFSIIDQLFLNRL